MRRLTPPIAFLATAVSLYLALHYYLWLRLIHAPTMPPLVAFILTLLLAALCAVPIAFGILPRVMGYEVPAPLERLGYLWLGSYFLLAAGVGAADLVGVLAGWVHSPSPVALLASVNGVATLGASVGFVCIGLALWGGLRAPAVREVQISTEGLPAGLAGLSIVQLSDVHIGPTLGSAFLADTVRRVNALNPDLVAITGDLIDASLEEIGKMMLPLRGLKPRLGVVYVPGNHEYYHGGPAWFTYFQSLGLHVLRNQGLEFRTGDQAFYVAGLDDPTSQRAGGGGSDLQAALRARPPGMPTLLLSHQPIGFEAAAAQGVSLQLSGHTHGGQLFPLSLLVGLRYRFVAGLYRRGQSYLYVSCGTGFWGPPMRLGAASEITLLSFA